MNEASEGGLCLDSWFIYLFLFIVVKDTHCTIYHPDNF